MNFWNEMDKFDRGFLKAILVGLAGSFVAFLGLYWIVWPTLVLRGAVGQ